jgi:hypothetical protein
MPDAASAIVTAAEPIRATFPARASKSGCRAANRNPPPRRQGPAGGDGNDAHGAPRCERSISAQCERPTSGPRRARCGRGPRVGIWPSGRWPRRSGLAGALRLGVAQSQAGAGGHHRRTAHVDGRDDLLGSIPCRVDRGRAEVGVTKLPLDDVQRHALTGQLKRVGVAQLVRRIAPPGSGTRGEAAELGADRCARPRCPRVRPLMMQNSGSPASSARAVSHAAVCSHPPVVRPDLAGAAAPAVSDEDRSAPVVEVGLGERQRRLDAKPRAP